MQAWNPDLGPRSLVLGQIYSLGDKSMTLAHRVLIASPDSIKAADLPALPLILRLTEYARRASDEIGEAVVLQDCAAALQSALSNSAIDDCLAQFPTALDPERFGNIKTVLVPTRNVFEREWKCYLRTARLSYAMRTLQQITMIHAIPWTTQIPRTGDLQWNDNHACSPNQRAAVLDLLESIEQKVSSGLINLVVRWTHGAPVFIGPRSPKKLGRLQSCIGEEARSALPVGGRAVRGGIDLAPGPPPRENPARRPDKSSTARHC